MHYSFSFWSLLLAVFLLALLVSHISWWVFRRYFPSTEICMAVHKNAGNWFSRERSVLRYLETPSVFGFLCTLLLMAIIPLNVTILAQVFELFVPSGDRITFPLIDSYGSFPLLVGLLFALVEVAFSALAEQKRKAGERRLSILIIIGIMIVVEAGLNFYRTWIMESDANIMTTFWDKMVGYGGPILAAFLGVIVPLAMVLLGGYAMLEFIMPVIKDAVIILRFLGGTFLIGIAVVLFGFHGTVELPGPVVRLRDKIYRLRKLHAEMKNAQRLLSHKFMKVKDNPLGVVGILVSKVDQLEQKVNAIETSQQISSNSAQADKFTFAEVKSKLGLKNVILKTKQEIREFRNAFAFHEHDFEHLSDQALSVQKAYKNWEPDYEAYLKDYENALAKTRAVRDFLQNSGIMALCESVEAALKNKAFDGVLPEHELSELRDIVEPQPHLSSTERDWRKYMADAAKRVVQAARLDILKFENACKESETWLVEHRLDYDQKELETDEFRLARIEKRLLDIDTRLNGIEDNQDERFGIIESGLRALALELRAVLIFLGLIIPLHKRI